MAAAAKKFVARDLCVIYGEADPRVSSIRVADRIHQSRRAQLVHDFVDRNRAELERYGNITRHTLKSGERGRPAFEYLLNEDQVTIVIMRSDSAEAADGRFEIVQLIRAYRRGEIARTDITIIDDLFAAQQPIIERGDDNVVHVKHKPRDDTPPTPDNTERNQHRMASTWAGDVEDEPVIANPLVGVRSPPVLWGEPLIKNRAHHVRSGDGRSYACQCHVRENGALKEFWIYLEPMRPTHMRERFVLMNTSEEILCRFDWDVSGLVALELLNLERGCPKSPLTDRQAEAVLTLLTSGV
jgi:hypothetical protein